MNIPITFLIGTIHAGRAFFAASLLASGIALVSYLQVRSRRERPEGTIDVRLRTIVGVVVAVEVVAALVIGAVFGDLGKAIITIACTLALLVLILVELRVGAKKPNGASPQPDESCGVYVHIGRGDG